MISDLKISIGQIEVKTGDITGNSQRIGEAIEKSIVDKADILILPESAITGYCCGSLFNHDFFIKDNIDSLNRIAKRIPKELHVVLGFVDFKHIRKDGFPEISNSVAILNDGKIIYTYDKQFMANGNHHEDKKYFLPGNRTTVCTLDIRGKKLIVGTPICEDVWSQDHVRNIPYEMKCLGAELLLVCNQSYFTYGKMDVRDKMYSDHAKHLNIPIVQVNAVGVGDIVKNIILFDGGSASYIPVSAMFTPEIKLFSLNRFEPEFKTITLNQFNYHKKESKYKEIWNALVFAQKEVFKNINISKAQVHLSGGLDSAIVACIVKEAMGVENTIFITNPTVCNSEETRGYAQYLADKLGVMLYWNSFQGVYEELDKSFKSGIGHYNKSDSTPIVKSTFHAVGRTAQGLAAANFFKSGIVCTGNHTENILGWATFHDIGSVGVMSIIGDLTKVEIYQFAKWINEHLNDEVIPKALYDGSFAPAAELPDNMGKSDPFDYWVVSGICADLIRDRKSKYKIIEEFKSKKLDKEHFPDDFTGKSIYDRITVDKFIEEVERCVKLMRISVFKSAQAAPNVLISGRSRGFSNRETIINHYTY